MRTSILLAATTLAAALAAAPTPSRAGPVLDTIHRTGILRVGTTGDYKPFSFRNPDGTYQGADIVMAQRLAASLGARIEYVSTTWAHINDDYAAGKFDIAVGGVTILPARTARGPFTRTTYVDGKRPIARCADRDRFTSVARIDAPDVRVIVNPGASNEDFARANFPHAKLTVHPDNPTVSDEIVANRADVFVTDGIEVAHLAHIHPELCPTNVPALFTRLEKAYWVQNDPELLAQVNTWLAREIDGGAWDKTLDSALSAP